MATEGLNKQEDTADTLAPAVELKVTADSITGYAAIQNNIPIVRSLIVKNNTKEIQRSIDVLVSCAPAFAQGARFHFEQLAPGETRTISPIDLQPDHTYLIKLDEAEKASIRVKVVTAGVMLAEINHPVEVLAYDQWAGTRSLPELLAAFSMPNSMVVDRLYAQCKCFLLAAETVIHPPILATLRMQQ